MDDVADRARKARVALELGRVRWAFVRALPVGVAAGAVALWFGDTRVAPAVCALLVLALVAVAGWRSRACILGAVAGIALGVVPFLAMKATGVLCTVGGRCVGVGQACCALGGLCAGLAVGFYARRLGQRMAVDVVAGACAGAALHVAIGCVHAGLFEGIGLIGALVVGAALSFRPARARA